MIVKRGIIDIRFREKVTPKEVLRSNIIGEVDDCLGYEERTK